MGGSRINHPSLLPYLQAAPGRFHLKIEFAPGRQTSSGEVASCSFFFDDVADPLIQVGKASIESDLAEQLLSLHLLVQRSEYGELSAKYGWTSNPAVDERWQALMATLSQPPLSGHHLLLSGQVGKDGRLVSLLPLVYCRQQHVFFHPPCPLCGELLTLCQDDALLTSAGLPPYSSTLHRFLHCPACCAGTGTMRMYASPPAATLPACRGDMQQLVLDWRELTVPAAAECAFPCSTCSLWERCYGEEGRARENIRCFSFYPFYVLLLHDTADRHVDLQALLAGAAPHMCCVRQDTAGELAAAPSPGPCAGATQAVPVEQVKADPWAGNRAIRSILLHITASWEPGGEEGQGAETVPRSSPGTAYRPPPPEPAGDLMKTVLLNSTRALRDMAAAPARSGTSAPQAPASFPPISPASVAPQETLLAQLRGSLGAGGMQGAGARHTAGGSLQDTLFIAPAASQRPGAPQAATGRPQPGQTPPPPPPAEDVLAETIILRTESRGKKP